MLDGNSGNKRRISKFRFAMILGYTLLTVSAIVIISALIFSKTDDVMKDKVINMTSSLNVQMKMNMDSYLDRLESTSTLVFSQDEVYSYSASDETADSYDALNTENIISDKLYSLCIMENYVDFGIVYSNNHTVGKISNGTVDQFGERLYQDLSSMVNRDRTNDGWSAGYNGNFKRIYYVKRINDNAVLVTSFYASELDEVFKHPGGINDITVRLVDSKDNIIYSSLDKEAGTPLPKEIKSRLADSSSSASIMDKEYLITVNRCGDNWKVICSVPTEIILKEKNDVFIYILIVGIAAALLTFLIVMLLSDKISDPVSDMMELLSKKASTDQLTALLNKKSFEEFSAQAISNAQETDRFFMILMDIDNFKGVNDTLGHAAGDKVLAEVGNTLRKQFRNLAYIGRLGGDEFGVFMESPRRPADEKEFVKNRCERLCEAFRNIYADGEKKYKVSVSIGAAFFPEHAKDFQELYTSADKALYISKKKGKDTFSIYGEVDDQ